MIACSRKHHERGRSRGTPEKQVSETRQAGIRWRLIDNIQHSLSVQYNLAQISYILPCFPCSHIHRQLSSGSQLGVDSDYLYSLCIKAQSANILALEHFGQSSFSEPFSVGCYLEKLVYLRS